VRNKPYAKNRKDSKGVDATAGASAFYRAPTRTPISEHAVLSRSHEGGLLTLAAMNSTPSYSLVQNRHPLTHQSTLTPLSELVDHYEAYCVTSGALFTTAGCLSVMPSMRLQNTWVGRFVILITNCAETNPRHLSAIGAFGVPREALIPFITSGDGHPHILVAKTNLDFRCFTLVRHGISPFWRVGPTL